MLAGSFLLILTDHGGGLAERVSLYLLIIWLIALGGNKLLADRKPQSIQKSDLPRSPRWGPECYPMCLVVRPK
jgi:hypothetical protein